VVVGRRRGGVRKLSAAEAVPNPKRQATGPGWWWSATNGKLVHYGSAAMRLHVMLLDRDPRICGLATRPLELRWHVSSGVRSHAPQLMFRLADGQGGLADCTGRSELSRHQRSLAAAVGEICAAVGWRYWVLGPVDPIYRRNVTLAGGIPTPAASRWPVTGCRTTGGLRRARAAVGGRAQDRGSAGHASRAVPCPVGGTAGSGPGGGDA
jgi:hypothetical protein